MRRMDNMPGLSFAPALSLLAAFQRVSPVRPLQTFVRTAEERFRPQQLCPHEPVERRAQEAVLYVNHALVNPPIDRSKPADQVKDVYVSIQKETDAGIYVSGAKVVATNSALTHYNFLGQNMGQDINDPSMVVMFMAPMDTPGIKLICRPSYELAAAATGSPWDYPLTSRFDENDAIFVMDNAFIPWENVFIHRDIERLKQFYPRSGFVHLDTGPVRYW